MESQRQCATPATRWKELSRAQKLAFVIIAPVLVLVSLAVLCLGLGLAAAPLYAGWRMFKGG